MKKIITAFIIALLILASAAGCTGNSGNEKSPTGDELANDGLSDPNLRANTPDSLPYLDFGGAKVTVLARTPVSFHFNEMAVEESTGEIVDDAIYMRNLMVEERLNCELQLIYRDGHWDVATEFNRFIERAVFANDDSFDIIAGYGYMMCYLAMSDLLYNLAEVPYIDYKQPWWPSNLVDELMLNGKMYMIAGDAVLSSVKLMNCILFNKQIAEDFHLPDF